jgi:hypothetical protein
MASVLPSNLSFFMSRLQGVATSHFKVNPQTSNTLKANNIVRFELPSNTLLNFRSLRLFFQMKITGNTASAPPDTSSFIERCSVYVGGVLVANGFNGYNTLVHAKAALQGSKCGTLGHPEMVRKVQYHSFGTDAAGAVLGDTDNETYEADSVKNDVFCIENFEGFLGSCEPSIMDTGALATIVIEFALADNAVVSSSKGRELAGHATLAFDEPNASPSSAFELSNMTMQVEVLSLASNVIDTIVEQRIAQVGYLSVPFKNYFSFANSHTNATRFNVNSASWDRLWVAYRPTTFSNTKAPDRVKGHKVAGGFVSPASIAATNAAAGAVTRDLGRPEYDQGGVLNTNSEKYKPHYFTFEEIKASAATLTNYQLQINSANIPSFPMTCPEALAMSMNSLDYYDKNHKITLHQYKKNYFVQCFRFCLPDSDYSRLASGLDCRGVSSSCSLNTNGLSACNVMLFAECTSELRIGAGRQIEVVV